MHKGERQKRLQAKVTGFLHVAVAVAVADVASQCNPEAAWERLLCIMHLF